MKNRLFKTLCHLLKQKGIEEEEVKQFAIEVANSGVCQMRAVIWQIRKEGY